MSLELALLPISEAGSFWMAHNILETHRVGDLYEAIMKLRTSLLPGELHTYLSREGDEEQEVHYGNTTKTPYGEPIEWLFVKDLLPLADHPGVKDSWMNQAVWAFLSHYPSEWKIALYWH